MGKDDVKQLFGKMEKDATLRNKYAELMQAHHKDAEKVLADKLIEFGKSSGFSFSKDDLLAARSEVMDKSNSNKELSDDDLASVAGGGQGKTNAVIVSVLSAGIGCALCSIDAAIRSAVRKVDGCGNVMSTAREC